MIICRTCKKLFLTYSNIKGYKKKFLNFYFNYVCKYSKIIKTHIEQFNSKYYV